ncbi:MAG: hypothetical protein ABIE55_01600 [Candidatus Aenigmatarchaeota archaeon]
MKKTLTGFVILSILLVLSVNIAIAEEESVSFDVTENETNSSYTVNIDIQISGNDTHVRDDLYGTATGSGPRDVILGGAEFDHNSEVREICYQPSLQAYFNQIGDIPPSGFAAYLKSLGYDDESHISFIWSLCQQEYINQQQDAWSTDSGVQPTDMVRYITGSIDWLLGREANPLDGYKKIGVALDSYFASDRDVWLLVNRINILEVRIEALEKTIERIASEEYCEMKVEALMKYNLSYVKCGENSTIYARVDPNEFGFNIIGYTNEDQCAVEWGCTDWSECENGIQTRRCSDANMCGRYENKPEETQVCAVVQEDIEEPDLTYVSVKEVLPTIQSLLLPLFVV